MTSPYLERPIRSREDILRLRESGKNVIVPVEFFNQAKRENDPEPARDMRPGWWFTLLLGAGLWGVLFWLIYAYVMATSI